MKKRTLKKDKPVLPPIDYPAYFREHSPYNMMGKTKEEKKEVVVMCNNEECTLSYSCWRFNMPPQKTGQEYREFQPKDDNPLDEGLECSFFIKMPE